MKQERLYRSFELANIKDDYIVEGYAALFERYPLFKRDGVQFYEQFTKEMFREVDTSDIIFHHNHQGPAFARSRVKNGKLTLEVRVDNKGLWFRADLSTTQGSRELYETIKAGLVDGMSWAFTHDGAKVDKESRTITYDKITKIFDVSSVDFGANPNAYVNARSIEGVLDEIVKEQELLEHRKVVEEAYKVAYRKAIV